MPNRIKSVLKRLPGAERLRARRYESWFASTDGYGHFRGVFGTFAEARASVPSSKPTGPDAAGYSEHHVDRMERVFLYDYPIMYWLRPILGEDASIFDLGGNVGVHYYGYQKYLVYPAGLSWKVCEVDTLIATGEKIARERRAPSLTFTKNISDADGCDVFVTSGALQYVEAPFLHDALSSLKILPKHLFINKMPLGESAAFVTLQNAGVTFLPQHVLNRGAFIQSLTSLGYSVRDEWETPHLSCVIPFHEQRAVPAYSGLYLSMVE